MTTIPPLPPPLLTVPGGGAAAMSGNVATVVSEVPQALQLLSAGSQVNAVVTGSPGPNLVQIQTESGSLTLRMAQPLATGTQLTLQVTGQGDQLAFRLTGAIPPPAVPGATAALPFDPTALLPGASAGPGGASQTAAPAVTVATSPASTGQLLPATVIRPADSTPGAPPPLPAGTTLAVRVVGLTTPAEVPTPVASLSTLPNPAANAAVAVAIPAAVTPPPAPAAAPATPVVVAGAGPPAAAPTISVQAVPPTAAGQAAAPTQAFPSAAAGQPPANAATPLVAAPPAAATGPSATLPTGAQPPAGPVAITPTPANPPAIAAGATLVGTVAANTLAGQPLVQSPAGLLALPASVELPPGGTVTLEVAQVTPPPATIPAAAGGAAGPLAAGPPGAAPLAAVNEALSALHQSDPAAARQMLGALPQAGPQLAANLMLAAGALGSRNGARIAFGDGPIDALERTGQRGLAQRLSDGLAQAAPRPALDAAGNQWQVSTLPYLDDGAVRPVRVATRRPQGRDDQPGGDGDRPGPGEDGRRFVVDVVLSRLGPVQLDGLVRRTARRFDLIVRTRDRLPDDMRRDINGLFAEACTNLGMAGSAIFQATDTFVDFNQAAPGGHSEVMA